MYACARAPRIGSLLELRAGLMEDRARQSHWRSSSENLLYIRWFRRKDGFGSTAKLPF